MEELGRTIPADFTGYTMTSVEIIGFSQPLEG